MPVTIPEVNPTVPIGGLALDQEPPVVTMLNEVVLPIQTPAEPVIAAGLGLTVLVNILVQPEGKT